MFNVRDRVEKFSYHPLVTTFRFEQGRTSFLQFLSYCSTQHTFEQPHKTCLSHEWVFFPQSFLQKFTNNPSFKSKQFSPVVHCVGMRPKPLNHEAQIYCHQTLKRVQNEYVNMCGLCLPSSPLQGSLLHAPQFDVE